MPGTNNDRTTWPSEGVQIISICSFGVAVVRHFRNLVPRVHEVSASHPSELSIDSLRPAKLTIFVSGQPKPDICSALDKYGYDTGLPFLPVVLHSKILRVGPLVVPGAGSCWACWETRSRQHAGFPKEEELLFEYYSSKSGVGPQGFLEAFSLLAAARLCDIVDRADLTKSAGMIWQFDVLTRQSTCGSVMGVHGCPRCGLRRDEEHRSTSDLQSQLRYLWEKRSGNAGA